MDRVGVWGRIRCTFNAWVGVQRKGGRGKCKWGLNPT